MDLTPPLTRSPASTPKTYCPSEASSDYPSPDLIGQHYGISSAYEACSMAPTLTPDVSSPRLDAVTHSEWSPASVLHPALTTASMTTILSAEYDNFASYDGPISAAAYPNDVYSGRSQNSPPPTLQGARSPVPSLARPPNQYPPISGSPSPKLRPEDMPAHYSHGVDASQYPSPSLAHTSYPPADMGPASSLAQSEPAGGYTPEGALAPWPRADQYPGDPEQLYAGGLHSPAMMPPRHGARVASRISEQQRRTTRKLTTKEEANFQCDVKGCGKFFSRSYNFKAHMETHRETREYPFPCQVGDCNKRFVRKTDLQRHHQSVHMKERKHGCEYCGRMFARRDTLKRHKTDGCHKRFDIGTMDLRAEAQDERGLFPLPNLPPLAIPPLGSQHTSVPSLRGQESSEMGSASPWNR